MAPKSAAAKHDDTQLMLRKVAVGTAAVGVLLDIISLIHSCKKRGQRSMIHVTSFALLPLGLSLVWNHLIFFKLSKVKNNVVMAMLAVADIAFFLGFLAISIGNGIVMKDLRGWGRGWGLEISHVELYTYNSVPWLVCATLHLLTAALVLHRVLNFGFGPKAAATCPDCQRKWHRGDPRSKDGAEDSLLAVHDYDEDADGA